MYVIPSLGIHLAPVFQCVYVKGAQIVVMRINEIILTKFVVYFYMAILVFCIMLVFYAESGLRQPLIPK